MICKENGCENKHFGRGYCRKHYTRWYRHGDPNIILYEMHGYNSHLLYRVWNSINQRCYNKNNLHYKDYGGRGIMMCDEWKNSAKTFIEWCLDNGWKKDLEIDRRDNDENYCPENCHFVTHIENNHNRQLLQKNNISGYRGVGYHKQRKKWRARIVINCKQKHLGLFNTPYLAAVAYDKAVPDNRPRNFK
jgi:hypothetical protein